MRKTARYIFILSFLMLVGILTSCHDETSVTDQQMEEKIVQPYLTLHISTLSTAGSNSEVVEKIKTLRIIILTENSDNAYLEYNGLIDFTKLYEGNDGEVARYFTYVFSHVTVPGKKKFYLIANEASVGNVNFQLDDSIKLPSDISDNMAFTDFLKAFEETDFIPGYEVPGFENGDNEQPSGKLFEDLMKAVYFEPDYRIEDGEILLPYVAYYDNYEIEDGSVLETEPEEEPLSRAIVDPETGELLDVEDPGDVIPSLEVRAQIYLVPVATKFTFHFYNSRTNSLEVSDLKIGGIAKSSFVNPNVLEADREKDFVDIEDLYWIDWLALIARYSQAVGGSDLSDYLPLFNETWGWIDAFEIPENAYGEDYVAGKTMSSENFSDKLKREVRLTSEGMENKIVIKGMKDRKPGEAHIGPFYFPESRYWITEEIPDEEGDIQKVERQAYYVYAQFKDTEDGSGPVKFNQNGAEIGNLKSLFRNTHIDIKFNIDEGGIGIYSEIKAWSENRMKGSVIDEEEQK